MQNSIEVIQTDIYSNCYYFLTDR